METATIPQVKAYTYPARDLRWDAPSDTLPGVVYAVTASAFDAAMYCDCPSRTPICKHIRRALAQEIGKPRCIVTARPCRR